MRVMIDTCILIDFLQNRMPFADTAQKIVELAFEEKFDGFLSAKTITDINYIIKRSIHDLTETNLLTGYLWQICDVLETTESDVFNAMFSKMSDYEDAVMVETAKRNNLDAIVTRNLKDFEKAELPVYSPEEFVKRLTS